MVILGFCFGIFLPTNVLFTYDMYLFWKYKIQLAGWILQQEDDVEWDFFLEDLLPSYSPVWIPLIP